MAAAIFLLFPALLINLGLVAFYDDEAIRALVAMEMQISGNYVTPTMFGELYYNKPPLYNWILLAVFELTGRNEEIITRMVTVFFLLVYAGSVYYFFGRNFDLQDSTPNTNSPDSYRETKNTRISQLPNCHPEASSGFRFAQTADCGLLTAFALITCGRILFWDSMLGLIDICFSWVMFLLFMVIYHKGERQQYGKLFAWAYFLAAIGYMLKGLPSVAFLGIALLTYFIWQKKMRQLFSWQHVVGGSIFIFIVGGYYFLYSQQNGLEEILKTVFHESAKRTFVEYGFVDTILHVFSFPFEMWYHFLPWTLLIICFFQKNIFQKIKENKFIFWNVLVFATTIVPYWTSVEVYPRYLFMHVPLVFSALFYFYLKNKKENRWQANMVEMVFFAATCLAVIVALLPIVWEKAQDVPFLHVKSIGIALVLSMLAYLFWQWKNHRMLVFVLVLLVTRTGYNFFILPSRVKIECSTLVRQSSQEVVEIANGQPIYIYKNSLGFQPMTGYYFTRETGKILHRHDGNAEVGAFYILEPRYYDPEIFSNLNKVKIKWECRDLIFGQLLKNEKQ